MALKIGSKAPDFNVTDQDGNPVTLANFKGKKLVLFFYPKDQTPGCTAEACNLRDNYTLLRKKGYEVVGVSTDSEKSHQNFISKQQLPFRLLADVDKKMHTKYKTWVEKSMYGRTYMGTARVTFILNEEGIIEDIVEKVDTKNHADQILNPNKSINTNSPGSATNRKTSKALKKTPQKKKK